MKRIKCIGVLLLLLGLVAKADKRVISDHWRFCLGEQQEASQANYDASEWRVLNLPHDWAFENGYSPDGAQQDRGGYASGGIGWYIKSLYLTDAEKTASRFYLDFDGVYRNAQVWLNGHFLGKCPYGYLPFSFDVTPYMCTGENKISVRVDNSLEPSARWYHGCGIYGDVYFRTHGDVYFEKDGTFVSYLDNQGDVKVKSVINNLACREGLHCTTSILDDQHRVCAQLTLPVAKQGADTLSLSMNVPAPRMWSPENPNLYKLILKVTDQHGMIVDEQQLRLGFREFDWEVDRGFFLNGQQYKLHGVCEHLEGGPTGAYYTPQLMRWKLQLLKNMGCNAIRTAHNPQLPYFYELCDEMGFLVMDEVFDGWKRKADNDYGKEAFAQCWENDLRTVIRRDRNHASVFLYSVGNETRGEMAADLVRVCHEEDPTRLVTSGSAGSEFMDVLGMNGHSEHKKFLETYQPTTQPFVATENPHTWQVRGYYRSHTWYRDGYRKGNQQMMYIPDLTDKEIFTYDWTSPAQKRNRKQVFNSSYDNATVRVTARHIIAALRDKNWFSGSFRWTGFDYLGEAGYVHGGWPFRAFQSGALDLAGFPKDLYFLYQSEWGDKDMVHILPHWTHPMMPVGTLIPVWVYTSGDEVELFLNGKSMGRQNKGKEWNKIQCEFMVPWTPGIIEAVAYRQGREIARSVQRTSGAPAMLSLGVENSTMLTTNQGISILTICQEDAQGILCPYGENRVYVAVDGPARVLSFENGSPVDTECNFQASSRRCFFGLNRIFLQAMDHNEQVPISVVLAAISGDKKLKQSDKVSISTVYRTLRGEAMERNLRIYYTIDGSEPTSESLVYQGPFAVSDGTEVKAVVFDGDSLLMTMSERFAHDEGLYWGKTDEENVDFLGEQTEQMQLVACEVRQDGKGVKGDAYVIPKPGRGRLDWYQENDGGKIQTSMTIRYSMQSKDAPAVMDLYNNERFLKKIVFENTGSSNAHWQYKKVKVTLLPGANQFSLRSIDGNSVPSLDQLDID